MRRNTMAVPEPGATRASDRPKALWRLAAALGVAAVAACSQSQPHPGSTAPTPGFAAAMRVVEGPERMECVPYARQLSAINLRGDAWTWWESADGLFDRGQTPEPGAVLVLRRQGRSLGHLAVVTRIVSERIILASHANWLNEGLIHENAPILDVSAQGDWSAVRVWYPPGNIWGKSVYAAYGFIYGGGRVASSRSPM